MGGWYVGLVGSGYSSHSPCECELCTGTQHTFSDTWIAAGRRICGLPPHPVCPLSRPSPSNLWSRNEFSLLGSDTEETSSGSKIPRLLCACLWLAHLTFTDTWLAHLTPAYIEALFRLKLASKHLTWRKIPSCSFIVCWCGWCLNLRSSGCSRCWWAKDEIYVKVSDYYLLVVTSITMPMQRNNHWNVEPKVKYCILYRFVPILCVWVFYDRVLISSDCTNVRLVSQVSAGSTNRENYTEHTDRGCVTVNLLVCCFM